MNLSLSAKLDELGAMVESARAMPMSASCILNRGEVLEQIDELRKLLPDEIASAQQVLDDRGAVVAEGRAEAEQILEAARAERARLIARTDIMRDAAHEAEALLAAARADADRMRREVDDYVDAKLANFEVVLHKTLQAVEKGRAKISGRHELDSLADGDFDDRPLPE